MEKSKIKNQKSKILASLKLWRSGQIKNKKFLIFSLSLLLLALPYSTFAHESDVPHEEVPASVDPMLTIGVVLFVAIGGIIIWKVMFSKKQTPPAQTPQVHTEAPKTDQQSTQPEKLEAKK